MVLLSCIHSSKDNVPFIGESSPICPKNHTDSIVPIIYGMPNEELFMQADSGLVWLGGCEITDDDKYWHCKKHNINLSSI